MTIQHLRGACVALAFALSLTASSAALAEDHRGKGRFRSVTQLSPDQEVQAVNDDGGELLFFEPAELVGHPAGEARAVISFDPALSHARVRVRFDGLTSDLTRLHLHCSAAGTNGPVAIGLIDLLNAANDNSANGAIRQSGHLVTGVLRNENFPGGDRCTGPIGRPVNNIASLAAAIEAGLIYWNLHTELNGPGELRGQVRTFQR